MHIHVYGVSIVASTIEDATNVTTVTDSNDDMPTTNTSTNTTIGSSSEDNSPEEATTQVNISAIPGELCCN